MSVDKVRFYVSQRLADRKLTHAPILFPFWGIPNSERRPFSLEVYQPHPYDTNHYELVDDIEKADFVLVPHRYNVLKVKRPGLFDAFVREAREHAKPVFVDGCGDIEHDIAAPDVYVMRTVNFKSFGLRENHIYIPYPSSDLLETYCEGVLKLREKQTVPSVSFAGWAHLGLERRIKRYIKEAPHRLMSIFNSRYKVFRQGVFFRMEAMKALEHSTLIAPNFLVRRSYSGHVSTAEKDPAVLRREFVDNLLNNDYALCLRGDSNTSTRFYEALSLGRIPFLIDTDCVLGFEDVIDYSEFMCKIDFRDTGRADALLREFHDGLTNEKFQEMQKKARQAYVEYMRVDGMSRQLMRVLKDKARHYKHRP